MRNLYLFVVLLAISLTSCVEDAVENLTTITTTTDITKTFAVTVTQDQLVYTASETFDASLDDDFAQYGDKIDNVTINNISYTILDNANYANESDASIKDATFSFKKANGGAIRVASISNLNLASALGVSNDMGLDQDALNAMAAEFKATNKIATDATVELDEPVSFDIEITVNMSVTGSVLN